MPGAPKCLKDKMRALMLQRVCDANHRAHRSQGQDDGGGALWDAEHRDGRMDEEDAPLGSAVESRVVAVQ